MAYVDRLMPDGKWRRELSDGTVAVLEVAEGWIRRGKNRISRHQLNISLSQFDLLVELGCLRKLSYEDSLYSVDGRRVKQLLSQVEAQKTKKRRG